MNEQSSDKKLWKVKYCKKKFKNVLLIIREVLKGNCKYLSLFSGPFLSQITLDKSMFGGSQTQRPSHHKPPDINNPNTENLNTSGDEKGRDNSSMNSDVI